MAKARSESESASLRTAPLVHDVAERRARPYCPSALWNGPARRPVVAGLLALVAAALVIGVAFDRRRDLGIHAYFLFAASAIGLSSALIWFTRRPLPARARARRVLSERRRELAQRTAALAAARIAFEADANDLQERLAAQELRLKSRLVTFHEWMEFPQPFSLTRDEPATSTFVALVEKDRELLKLLDEETHVFFGKIQENAYVTDGRFQIDALRDDAWRLVQKVARLYEPSADQPWLETSFSQILRSASRVCLQGLVVLDRLPLNVKELNLNSLYRHVRQAVSAYGVYKATEPYMPYLNTAYYLGRVALGGNPASMGAWWFLGQHGKKFAREFTTRLVQRQILVLLRDVVRVVGFETARIYGGDFNRRDANWIYGVELAELVRLVPLSPDSFASALREVGALQLRNEYDRVFLYRCMASGQSADPERYRALELLAANERHVLVRRLESFVKSFRVRGAEHKSAQWARGVEQRLGVRLNFERPETISTGEQLGAALRSLAGYLLDVKQREPNGIPTLLAECRTAVRMAAEQRDVVLARIAEDPPFFFEHPDIDPEGPACALFLADLVQLAVGVPPHLAEMDVVLANAAVHLRHDADEMRRRIDEACRARFIEQCENPGQIKARMPPAAIRAALDLIEPGESVQFVYGRVQIEQADGKIDAPRATTLWLMGVAQRLVLFSLRDDRPSLLWTGDARVQTKRVDGWFGSACRLSGGEWRDETADAMALVVPGMPLKRYDDFFQALLAATRIAPPDKGIGNPPP